MTALINGFHPQIHVSPSSEFGFYFFPQQIDRGLQSSLSSEEHNEPKFSSSGFDHAVSFQATRQKGLIILADLYRNNARCRTVFQK